jgi:hypothetical protein
MLDIEHQQGDTQMTTEAKKAKILAAIASRGWFTCDIYLTESNELRADGIIKISSRYFTGGNRKCVWIAA